MKIKIIIYITLGLIIPSSYVLANHSQDSQGTIEDVEFVIKKEKKVLLPEASRLFKKAPVPISTDKPNVKLTYELYDITPVFQPLEHKIKILKAKQDLLSRLYGKYIKLGHGNYNMPYITLLLDNTRNNKYAYGLHVSHISQGKNSYLEKYHNEVDLHVKRITDQLVYIGQLTYNWDKYPFLHNINDINTLENSKDKYNKYHQVELHTTIYKFLPSSLNYYIGTNLIHLRNHPSIHESQGKAMLQVDYTFDEMFKLHNTLDLHLIQYENVHATSLKRLIGHFKPILQVKVNKFRLGAGANLAYQNDPTALLREFDVYPELKLAYKYNKALRPYMTLSGTIQANSWQSYILQNPWLAPNIDIRHTNQTWVYHTGVESDLFENFTCHTGVSLGNYQNLPCFINNQDEPREFNIVYDESATVVNIFTELSKSSLEEALVTRLKGEYIYYKLSELKEAWHRPQYSIELLNTYNFYNKILLKNTMYWLGGIYALDPYTQNAISLSDIVDIGISVEYLWNKRFSIFIDCKNLLAKANNRYLHNPTTSTHISAGLTYSW